MHLPFDQYTKDYDRWFEEKGYEIFNLEVEAFKKLSKYKTEPSIEIGVGTGRFAERLGIAFGFDPSTKALAYAKKRNILVFQSKAENAGLKDSIAGSLFLIVTICFVDDVEKTYKEASRILKKGGYIFTGFVPKDSDWGKFYIEKKREGHKFYKYATFFSYEEVEKYHKKNGFKIIDTVSTLFSPPFKNIDKTIKSGYYENAGFVITVAEKIEDV